MCGACGRSSGPGTGPGLIVVNSKRPSESVAQRPNPVNPSSSGSSSRVSSGCAYRPAAFACQISTRASSTGSPSPSKTEPRSRIAPGWLGATSASSPSYGTSMCRNGPIVWEGVSRDTSILHRGRLAAAQDDVVFEAERLLGHGPVVVVSADHPLAVLRVANRVEDRILEEERIAGEEHLGDQPRGEGGPEQREVDVPGAPGVRPVLPRVGAGLDRDELVAALVVGHAPSPTAEIGVEG